MNHQVLISSQYSFKADMKSKIQRETAAILFLWNLYLKQGIDKVYVMVDLICMGILELQGTRSKN